MSTHKAHLCLEAEYGDGDADDGSDPQSEKHCFGVIVTKNKEQHSVFWGTLTLSMQINRSVLHVLPGNWSSHIWESQGLWKNNKGHILVDLKLQRHHNILEKQILLPI